MDIYEIQLEKEKDAAEKYKALPLKEFLESALTESGYSLKRMDNVYIGEVVQLPSVW